MHAAVCSNLTVPDVIKKVTGRKIEGAVVHTGDGDANGDDIDNNTKGGANKRTKNNIARDKKRGGRAFNPEWLRLKDRASPDTVFDADSNSGKKNLKLLPLIRHTDQKTNNGRFKPQRPCIQYYWKGTCNKGLACGYTHRQVWNMSPMERKNLKDAVTQINDNLT